MKKEKKTKQKTRFLTATTMLPPYQSECRMPVFQAPYHGVPQEGVVLGTHTYMYHFKVMS